MTKIFLFQTCIILGSCLWLASCSEVQYKYEDPIAKISNLAPEKFDITTLSATNSNIELSWTVPKDPEGEVVHFEISLNDSVIAYDLSKNSYILSNLVQDKSYKITVSAYDIHRNVYKVEKIVTTLKSFIKETVNLGLNYNDVIISSAIHMKNKNIILWGRGRELSKYEEYKYFMVDLNSDYSIRWRKEFNWALSNEEIPVSISECDDNGFIVAQFGAISKLDDAGNQQWQYKIPSEYNMTFIKSAIKTLNGNYLAIGQGMKGCLLFLLSSTGVEKWHKFVSNSSQSFPEGLLQIVDGEMIVRLGNNNGDKNWLYFNEEGTQLSETAIAGSGTLDNYISTTDDCFLFSGLNGATNVRITKVNPQGNIKWSVYPELVTNTGLFCAISDMCFMEGNKYLILTKDDRGITLAHLNNINGSIEKLVKLTGYPHGVFINYSQKGYYEMITLSGYLIRFNVDGFVP